MDAFTPGDASSPEGLHFFEASELTESDQVKIQTISAAAQQKAVPSLLCADCDNDTNTCR